MPKLNLLFVAAGAGLLTVSSCQKRVFPRPFEFCNISSVTVIGSGSPDTSIYQLSYDLEGRLTGILSSGTGGPSARTYSYAGTDLIVRTTAGGSTTTDSVVLNSDGLMVTDVNRNSVNPNWMTTFYFYSGTEVTGADLCQNCETPPAPGPVTWEYTWTSGDLTAFIPQPGFTTTTSTTYSYNNSAAATGDYWSVTQLLTSPAPIVMSTHQLDTYFQNYGTSTVSYAKNADGRISGMTIITSGPAEFGYGAPDTVNYSYQYACEVPLPRLKD